MIQIVGRINVAVAGTPVQVTAGFAALSIRFTTCHAALFQALHDNTGRIYIGASNLNRTTRANCAAVLAVPSGAAIPSFGVSLPASPAGVDLAGLYLDADTSGEGVLLTLLIT